MSLTNNHSTLRKIPEDRRSHLHLGGNLYQPIHSGIIIINNSSNSFVQ
jgi:hypothetical protein